MNCVTLIGNLTRDPEIRHTDQGLVICTFSLALNRGKDKDGKDKGADFPRIICFDKQAENCGKYLNKGSKVGVMGKIRTGSYERNGEKVYTTDVVASSVEFLKTKGGTDTIPPEYYPESSGIPEGFEPIEDDDIPFL